VDTAKLELAAQRYLDAKSAYDAAVADLRVEAATALKDGADVAEIAALTGWTPEQLRSLG
jgi:hypothetical protein